MPPEALPERALVCLAPPSAFAPMTRVIFSRLGYPIYEPEEFSAAMDAYDRPDLWIVDERNLAEIPDDGGPTAPIVVLTGRHGVTGADSRIAGAVRRPAGLHELYRVVQQVLEDTPRSSPRVATHLPARCRHADRTISCLLLSLSENGGLIRSPEPLALGSKLVLEFALPGVDALALQAEVAYQLLPDLGVVFERVARPVRESLARYVTRALAA